MHLAYYNENNKFAAQWLRNLIDAKHIAPGHVDERSITDVQPADLCGYAQHHFFAGVGVWSYALRAAGWPDDRPIWTGSCPCQPFSGAGKREGVADPRHLWPVWWKLIREHRPGVVIGEQVASRDGLGWWDIVSGDLESEAYAAAALDLCVPGIGGPHIRQRLYWMADATYQREHGRGDGRTGGRVEYSNCGEPRGLADAMRPGRPQRRTGTGNGSLAGCGASGGLGDTSRAGQPTRERRELPGPDRHEERRAVEQRGCASGGLANADQGRRQGIGWQGENRTSEYGNAGGLGDTENNHGRLPDRPWWQSMPQPVGTSQACRPGPLNGFWRNADWLFCTDGKWRPVEPGSFPLAHGVAGRVGKLRAYGNAICAPQAIQFIQGVMQCTS